MGVRTLLALLAAPALAGAVVWLPHSVVEGPESATMWLVFILLYSYPCALLFGGPLHYLMRRRNLSRLWHYALGGLLIGLMPALIVVVAFGTVEDLTGMALVAGVGGFYGVLAAAMFWLLAIWRGFRGAAPAL
jgi:hypothetical protein